MLITSVKIFRYSLPLINIPFSSKNKITVREGLILKLGFDESFASLGEIAPLPGFSNAGIGECLTNFKAAVPFLIKESVSGGLPGLEAGLFSRLNKIRMYPEVRFGIEMAVLNGAAVQSRMALSKFLSGSSADTVVLNGLFADTNEPLEHQVGQLLRKGYKLIKLKAKGSVDEDAGRLKAVVNILNNRAQVHVDANQKWSFEDAVLFSEKTKGLDIKYIEEPFADISRIPEFFRRTNIPAALDESLVSPGFDYSKTHPGIKFLVLKPMLLGGIREVLRIVNCAKKNGMRCIISSSFESGLGLWTLAHLAAGAGKDVTAGLDTLQWFESDLLKSPLPVNKGEIIVSGKSVLEDDIRGEYLTEV